MNENIEHAAEQDEVPDQDVYPSEGAALPASAAPAGDSASQPTDDRDGRAITVPLKDPRRRMRELLAIPDSQRSDAEWDELIELEISLAPGNRVAVPNQGPGAPGPRQEKNRKPELGRRPDQGQRTDQPGRQDPKNGMRPGKRFFKKPKRPGGPQGGSQGGPSGSVPPQM